jgi:hypothetical protein
MVDPPIKRFCWQMPAQVWQLKSIKQLHLQAVVHPGWPPQRLCTTSAYPISRRPAQRSASTQADTPLRSVHRWVETASNCLKLRAVDSLYSLLEEERGRGIRWAPGVSSSIYTAIWVRTAQMYAEEFARGNTASSQTIACSARLLDPHLIGVAQGLFKRFDRQQIPVEG